jgi:hypothetical protein
MLFHPFYLGPFGLVLRLQHHFHLHLSPYFILLETIQARFPYYYLDLAVFIEHLCPSHLSPPMFHIPFTVQLSLLGLLLLNQPIQETLLLVHRLHHLLSLCLL